MLLINHHTGVKNEGTIPGSCVRSRAGGGDSLGPGTGLWKVRDTSPFPGGPGHRLLQRCSPRSLCAHDPSPHPAPVCSPAHPGTALLASGLHTSTSHHSLLRSPAARTATFKANPQLLCLACRWLFYSRLLFPTPTSACRVGPQLSAPPYLCLSTQEEHTHAHTCTLHIHMHTRAAVVQCPPSRPLPATQTLREAVAP